MNVSEEIQPKVMADGDGSSSPYKGLDYFVETDHDSFAGREVDVRKIVARIVTQRALVLYGRSGLGKTSLLLAGVFPELRERGFLPIYVRALGSPVEKLITAIQRACGPHSKPRPDEPFTHWLATVACSNTVVIVFDQFEEFFIQFNEQTQQLTKLHHTRQEITRARALLLKERDRFIDLVAELTSNEGVDLRIVFSLREDYLAALDGFQRQLPDLFRDSHRLLPLTAFGAREAIVQPLQGDRPVPYDERLVTRLINELADFDFDSARLQIICSLLFRLARCENETSPQLKEEYLTALHSSRTPGAGMDWVHRLYVDEAFKALPKTDNLLFRIILDALITPERTKRALRLDQLIDLTGREREELVPALKQLAKQKLVRAPTEESDDRYELIHECLIPEFLKWLDSEPEFAGFRRARDIVADASRGDSWRNNPDLLLFEEQLTKLVNPHKERLRLDEVQIEYVLTCCIYGGVDDAGYWAKKLNNYKKDQQAGVDILLKALAEKGARTRRAAARVAWQFPSERVFARCWQLAIGDQDGDPDEEVRRSAARAVAAIGSPAQLAMIRQQLRFFGTRRRVLDALAAWPEADRRRAGVFVWWRRQAMRKSEKALWREHQEEIEEKLRPGTITGLWSAALWSFICVPVFAFIFGWIPNPFRPGSESVFGDDSSPLVWCIILLFPIAGAGALLGWRTALAGARTVALEGRLNSGFAVRRMLLPFFGAIGVWLVLLIWVGTTLDLDGWTYLLDLVIAPVLAWLSTWVLSYAVAGTCRGARYSQSMLWRLGWAVLSNLLFFLALPFWIILPLLRWLLGKVETPFDFSSQFMTLMLAGSFVHWITSVTLMRTAPIPPPAKPPRRIQARIVVGAISVTVLTLYKFGFFSTVVINDIGHYTNPLAAWPMTSYFEIESSNRLFLVSFPEDAKVNAYVQNVKAAGHYGPTNDLSSGNGLFLPNGRGSLSVSCFLPGAQMVLTPVPLRSSAFNLSTSASQIVQCDLFWDASAQAFTGTISGSVSVTESVTNLMVQLPVSLPRSTLFNDSGTIELTQFGQSSLFFEGSPGTNSSRIQRTSVSTNEWWVRIPDEGNTDYDSYYYSSVQIRPSSDGKWRCNITLKLIPDNVPPANSASSGNAVTRAVDSAHTFAQQTFHSSEQKTIAPVISNQELSKISILVDIRVVKKSTFTYY